MRNVHGTLPLRISPSRALKKRGVSQSRALVRLPLRLTNLHSPCVRSAIAMRTFLIPPIAAWPAQRKSIVRPTSLIVLCLASSPLREIELRGGSGAQLAGAFCTVLAAAPATTVVCCDFESFDGFGSSVADVTCAVSVTRPGLAVLTVTTIVATAPSGSEPRLHCVAVQLPWLEVAETNVVPAGMVLCSTTPCAVSGEGPMFSTWIV